MTGQVYGAPWSTSVKLTTVTSLGVFFGALYLAATGLEGIPWLRFSVISGLVLLVLVSVWSTVHHPRVRAPRPDAGRVSTGPRDPRGALWVDRGRVRPWCDEVVVPGPWERGVLLADRSVVESQAGEVPGLRNGSRADRRAAFGAEDDCRIARPTARVRSRGQGITVLVS